MKILGLIFLFSFSILFSQSIRQPRDTVGFCWTSSEINSVMKFLETEENNASNEIASKNIVAGISPHDDYLYAGKVYFPLYKMIHAKEIVVFGVTHGTVRKAMNDPQNVIILDEFEKWKGAFGNVEISPLREKIKSELDSEFQLVSNKAQSIEHSIEALVPFLQYYNRDIKITPIMITAMSFERMQKISGDLSVIIKNYMLENNYEAGRDIFFLISNDANHYGKDFDNSYFGLDANAHKEATANDKRIINENLEKGITPVSLKKLTKEIWESGSEKYIPLWCGRYPIVFGLLTVTNLLEDDGKTLNGKLLKYSDTLTEGVLGIKNTSLGTTAPFSEKHWVGFFSAAFYTN